MAKNGQNVTPVTFRRGVGGGGGPRIETKSHRQNQKILAMKLEANSFGKASRHRACNSRKGRVIVGHCQQAWTLDDRNRYLPKKNRSRSKTKTMPATRNTMSADKNRMLAKRTIAPANRNR